MRYLIMCPAVFLLIFFTAARGSFAAAPDLRALASESAWEIVASEGVKLELAREPGEGGVLRLDFDFVSGAGYAGIQHKWPAGSMPDLPENYAFTFKIKSALPENNLEFKLTDPTGENVWWVNRPGFKFTGEWQEIICRKRQIKYAWGPSQAKLTGLSALEVVIASKKGGKAPFLIKDLLFAELQPERASNETPVKETGPGLFLLDFKNEREFGGVEVAWSEPADLPGPMPARAVIEVSDEAPAPAAAWRAVAFISGPLSKSNFVRLPDHSARALRVRTFAANGGPGPLPAAVRLLGTDFAESENTPAIMIAAQYRRGVFPKAILGGEQSNWTVLGASGDEEEILVNEEGQAETSKGGPSFEPFVLLGGKLLTWADGANTPALREGYLPIAEITRLHSGEGLKLQITAFVEGPPGRTRTWLRYRLTNTGRRALSPELVVALRPFQTLPPWQWLNITGGVASVSAVDFTSYGLVADGREFFLFPEPGRSFAAAGDQGDAIALLSMDRLPAADKAACPHGRASAAGAWKMTLGPGKSGDVVVMWRQPGAAAGPASSAGFEEALGATTAWWKNSLGRIKIKLPKSLQAVADTARSQVAYIHINRDGAGIQPGSRSYERSWIRDGAMTSLSLLEFNQPQVAMDFVDWYASRQFESGKVPCVVDKRGPDPVPEHDSHGQLIFAIANVYRYTGDLAFLKRNFTHIEKAVGYIKTMRATRMTEAFTAAAPPRQEAGRPAVPAAAFYGLMPESISHEGYSAKPMHSYWDDYFTLRGLKDAADMAAVMGNAAQAADWSALAADFRATLLASLKSVMTAHGIDYLPGCAELGDFDATSTAVAVTPCAGQQALPPQALKATFDRYWAHFSRRRDDPSFKWVDYTPYELRVVGAMVMLGEKQRAAEMLDWFMKDRHPEGFNHWAEIVHSDRSKPAWIGDMPHTWVGSDFLRSLRTMFLYEDEAAGSTHVFAGIPAAWLAGRETIGFEDFATPHGTFSAEMVSGDKGLKISLSGDQRIAALPGGIVVHIPADRAPGRCLINGVAAEMAGSKVIVRTLPAVLELTGL